MYQLIKSLPPEFLLHVMELLLVIGIVSIAWLVLNHINLGIKKEHKHQCRRFMISFVLVFFFITCSVLYNPDQLQIFPILANLPVLYLSFLFLSSLYRNDKRFDSNKYELRFILLAIAWTGCCLVFFNTNDDRIIRSLVVTIITLITAFHNIAKRIINWKINSYTQKASALLYSAIFIIIAAHVLSVDQNLHKTDVSLFALTTISMGMIAYLLEFIDLESHKKVTKIYIEGEPLESSLPQLFIDESEDSDNSSKGDLLIIKYQEWINQHYNNVDGTVEKAVQEIGTSYATLNRRLKESQYPTSKKMLHEYRLLKAKEFLISESSSMVALNTGFKTASHFTKAFKIQFGMTPSEFKKTV